jgi:hypothetical protein
MKLFKEAYYGLHGKKEYRFYFEDENVGLFVWLNDHKQIIAFQADYKNLISFHFNQPNVVGIKIINNEPISGGITGKASQKEIEIIKQALFSLKSEDYPNIVRIIRKAVKNENIDDFSLPKDEINKLMKVKIVKYCYE